MGIYENAEVFAGKPVVDFDPSAGVREPAKAYRLRLDYEEAGKTKFPDLFGKFLADARSKQVSALVIGTWCQTGDETGSDVVVKALTAARDKLPNLNALFLGDIVLEESEISWINQSDISPLWQAFPNLLELRVRGGNGLSLGRPRHARLKSLVIETGGLPAKVLAEVAAAELPQLEHLELWLGDEGYGWDGTVQDVLPLLQAGRFPRLAHLGLRDSQIADDIAKAVASAPILRQLKSLDLSLGTIGDAGAEALIASPGIRALQTLDVSHHYISPPVLARLKAACPRLVADDPQDASETDGDRYVAVSE